MKESITVLLSISYLSVSRQCHRRLISVYCVSVREGEFKEVNINICIFVFRSS